MPNHPKFCKVALPLPLAETYTYAVPEGMQAEPGRRAVVPFGRRSLTGVITEMADSSDFAKTKPLRTLLDEEPVVSKTMLRFTQWIADYYLAGWGEVLPLACPPKVRQAREVWIECVDSAGLESLAASLTSAQKKSSQALLRLAASSGESMKELKKSGLSATVFSRAEAQKLIRRIESVPRLKDETPQKDTAPKLNADQKTAVEQVSAAMQNNENATFLMHGVTGSGKTEVYLKALDACLKQGKGAIVLVPEIALTPQTWRRFEARFPGLVSVLHSGLSATQREQGLARIRSGEARVALGPRSALFAPVPKLGLIVVDEESEPSYKQENSPRYHARDAALVRARMEKAVTLLGSATPSFESWANARSGKYKLLTLKLRASGAAMPTFEFVHLADHKATAENANDAMTPPMLEAVEKAAAARELSLLFLNRRGFAPVLACAKCGEAEQCPNCSISLTFHREQEQGASGAGWLRCHLCGHTQRPPMRCEKDSCKGALLRAVGSGTQRLEEEIHRRLPGLQVERVDRDTATRWGFHKELASKVLEGRVDVLVGTQMIAKGLDFPKLTQVGVINADASLNFPDFRAGERTFQLLVQVAGRAGRADKPGKVWVQTRQPGHPCLLAAAAQDFSAFYDSEIKERRELGYPPFGRLAAVIVRSQDKAKALKAAADLTARLQKIRDDRKLEGVLVLGPAPAPLVQIKDWWRYRILVKTRRSADRQTLLASTAFGAAPSGVRWAVDLDPVQFM